MTSLRVAVSGDPAACPSAENLELIQAGVSERVPLETPAAAAVVAGTAYTTATASK